MCASRTPPTRSRRSWNPALPATALSRTNRASRSRSLWPTACPRCCTTPLPGSSARCTAAGAARWPISSVPPSRRCAPSAHTGGHPRRHRPLASARAASRSGRGRGRAEALLHEPLGRARAPARGRQRPCSISRASTPGGLRSSASRRGRSPCRMPAPCAGRTCSGRTARPIAAAACRPPSSPCDPRGQTMKHFAPDPRARVCARTCAAARLHGLRQKDRGRHRRQPSARRNRRPPSSSTASSRSTTARPPA